MGYVMQTRAARAREEYRADLHATMEQPLESRTGKTRG